MKDNTAVTSMGGEGVVIDMGEVEQSDPVLHRSDLEGIEERLDELEIKAMDAESVSHEVIRQEERLRDLEKVAIVGLEYCFDQAVVNARKRVVSRIKEREG